MPAISVSEASSRSRLAVIALGERTRFVLMLIDRLMLAGPRVHAREHIAAAAPPASGYERLVPLVRLERTLR